MNKRSDVHSPTNLVTEDYEFAFGYDAHPELANPEEAQYRVQMMNALVSAGFRFDQVHGGDTCDHCGQRLRFVMVMKHLPTKTLIKVGEGCLGNRFELATIEYQRLRREGKLNRERKNLQDKRASWFAVDPDREVAFAWAEHSVEVDGNYGWNGTRHDFVHRVNRHGETSDKFVRMIMRDMARSTRIAEERAAEQAFRTPVVVGRGVVTGEVVKVDSKTNDWGTRLVFTVKDDRNFLVWGSVPAAISEVERGDRVQFTATLSQSDNDPCFGFLSRPAAAKVL